MCLCMITSDSTSELGIVSVDTLQTAGSLDIKEQLIPFDVKAGDLLDRMPLSAGEWLCLFTSDSTLVLATLVLMVALQPLITQRQLVKPDAKTLSFL